MRAPLIAMAAALVAGTGLAAVMLAPFGELLFHSADLAERSGTGIGKHVDPTYLLGFFMYDYWGRATDTPLLLLLFSRSWYIGRAAADAGRGGADPAPARRAALDRRRRRRCCWR